MSESQVLAVVSETAGFPVKATDTLESLGMDSLDWLGVLVDLDIEPTELPTTMEQLIARAGHKC